MVENTALEWLPIESNPDIFTSYAQALGFQNDFLTWHDILALEDEVWSLFTPQPIFAVVLCYEIKP